jgi:hypothetical protein
MGKQVGWRLGSALVTRSARGYCRPHVINSCKNRASSLCGGRLLRFIRPERDFGFDRYSDYLCRRRNLLVGHRQVLPAMPDSQIFSSCLWCSSV